MATPLKGISPVAAREWVENHSLLSAHAPSSVAEAWRMVQNSGFDAYAKRFGAFSPSDTNDCWQEAKQCRERLKNSPFCNVGDRYQTYKGDALVSCHGETQKDLQLVTGPGGCRVLPRAEAQRFLRRHPRYQQQYDCPAWVPGSVKYPWRKHNTPNLQFSALPNPWRGSSKTYVHDSDPFNSLARSAFKSISSGYRRRYSTQNYAERTAAKMRLFDDIFRNPKLVKVTQTPIVLFRGTQLPLAQKYPFQFTEKGYVAATTSEEIASHFASHPPHHADTTSTGIVSMIHVPAGIPYIAGRNWGEKEVVLPRGLTFRSVPSADQYAHLYVIPRHAPPIPSPLGPVTLQEKMPPLSFSLPRRSTPIKL